MEATVRKNLKYNIAFNLMDGGFYGLAIGFASFTTIIPLFVSSLTSSALLIGLIPAIHTVGWQLPQLFNAGTVSRQNKFKSMVMRITVNERLPFLGLALVAFFLPKLTPQLALVLTFSLLVWQGLGAGFTANPWQNLIMRIIPGELRATFLGAQSAVANLLCAFGAGIAGFLLEAVRNPINYSLCFLIAVVGLALSWLCVNQTREPDAPTPTEEDEPAIPMRSQIGKILRENVPFRWFLISRIISQFATMAFSFYMVYAARNLHMTDSAIGLLTSLSFFTQVIANPLTGWLSDRIGRKIVLALGAACAAASSLLAALVTQVSGFYLVIVLSGIATTILWTIGIVYSTEFGSEKERPAYIGMSNTLVAPATFIAPIIGGLLADSSGFSATFIVSAVAGLITTLILLLFLQEQRRPHSTRDIATPFMPGRED